MVIKPGIDALLMEPAITGEDWCQNMPCVDLWSTGLVLNQPYSTLLVYLLGLLWLWAGWRFWQVRAGQRSRAWWSVSLVLGGIAALSAGTSYQAFGYELKCAGRELCSWTSWWEIAYLTLQVGSLNAMVAAVAYSCTTETLRRAIIAYAFGNYVLHLAITIIGVLTLNRFLISFELLLIFTVPSFLLFFALNGARYRKHKQPLDSALLVTWTLMVMTNVCYFAYLALGITGDLWARGIWFSENDVLHIAVMIWLLYVTAVLSKRVTDYPAPATQGHS